MCGIVGFASASLPVDREMLVRARETLRHRGPDGEGLWVSDDRRVGLAHRRLAVIDLSPSGAQPMADPSGEVHVAYNGEIYNFVELRRELVDRGHRFRGTSDTEVLLAAYREWDTGCLDRLDGMFAFALHDARRGRLFLARDRVGEKPLFYRHAAGQLAFASEVKALVADPSMPRRLDLDALDFYLAYGYAPGDRCLLRGVRKLPAAHALTYEPGRDTLRAHRYWELPPPGPAGPDPEDGKARLAELESLLSESVRRRLVADVPVGILLSGGLDSSLVAALAVRARGRGVRTFTVTFPGHPDHDEARHARLVARHLGTEHTEVAAEADSLDLLPEMARQLDEPIADSSTIPTALLSRAIRPHVTVALGGDGGDELFGGYPHYQWLALSDRLRGLVPSLVRGGLSAAAERWLAPGRRGRNHLIGLRGDRASALAHVNLYFDRTLRRRLVVPRRPGGENGPFPEAWRASLCDPGFSLLQQATRADFVSTLTDGYLVKVDRASMLSSLEVRTPWLDHRLVEFAFGRVPDDLRAGPGGRKVLPRLLARGLLPGELDLDRKQGLSMPIDAWLRKGAARLEAILAGVDPALFDRQVVRALLAGQRRGRRNAQRLFALALLEEWRRAYAVGL